MINNKIFELADQLKDALAEQAKGARQSIEDLPEGPHKEQLGELLRKAKSGKVTVKEVQKEISKILANAG
jgi:tRNA(Ile2) C34 agmatinyltransferase TiaS